jgi:hypothetical protein
VRCVVFVTGNDAADAGGGEFTPGFAVQWQ